MIERARPEDAGITSASILEAIDEIDRKRVPIHSLLVMRHGRLVAEAYWAPWKRERLHRLYSITKSLTAIAIGCLEEEGKLSLSDHIIDYFPEYCPDPVHPYLSAMTIRDMLMMRTCHSATTYKTGCGKCVASWKKEWVKSFFDTEPDHAPGSLFIYDTSSSHVLAYLIEKLSGMDFMSYLRVKFMDRIGVSDDSYITKDPEGRPCGGSGVMMRPIDLMKIISLVHEKGHGLIPEAFLDTALSSLSATDPGLGGEGADERAGYGYFFWRMSHNASAMYGMGGQYAISVPDKDMVIVTTADTQPLKEGTEIIRHAVWKIVESAADCPVVTDEEKAQELSARLSSLSVPLLKSVHEPLRTGRHIYEFRDNSSGLESISYSFAEDSAEVTLKYRDAEYSFKAYDGRLSEGDFPVRRSSPYNASCGWLSDGTFSLLVYLSGEELGTIRIQSAFDGDYVTVLMSLYGEVSFTGFEGVFTGRAVLSGA